MRSTLIFVFSIASFFFSPPAHAQFGGLLKKLDSTVATRSGMVTRGSFSGTPPTQSEISSGLKDALQTGLLDGVKKVSAKDGFFANLEIKLLFPPEAKKIESTLRSLGFNHLCDQVILSMNRAAEDAARKAAPIFLSALSKMRIQDALSVLTGPDHAATDYFRKNTNDALTASFRPVIDSSLKKVRATEYWGIGIKTYNQIPFVSPANPDLTGYATQKAIDGLFVMVAKEEEVIRKNVGARSTPLMRKVFGFADQQKK